MRDLPRSDIFLRRATPADASALTDIAIAAKAHRDYPPETLAGWRDELTVAAADLREGLTTVAELDGRAVGFCTLGLRPPAIEHLWVHPEAMGRGIGRALLGRAAERARDLALLGRWLREPHVARWWRDWRRELAMMRQGLTEPRMHQRIVTLDGEPFAYLQHYRRHDFFEPFSVGLPAATAALDTFIGERAALGRGLGQRYLRLAAEARVAAGATLVTVDPELGNRSAVGAYRKAGFVGIRTLRHRRGAPVHLMAWRG